METFSSADYVSTRTEIMKAQLQQDVFIASPCWTGAFCRYLIKIQIRQKTPADVRTFDSRSDETLEKVQQRPPMCFQVNPECRYWCFL